MKKNMMKLLISAILLSALIGIFGILMGDFNEEIFKALTTTFIIIGFSIVGIIYAQIEKDVNIKYSIPIGMGITIFYFAIIISDVWGIIPINEKFIGSASFIAGATLWINILLAIKERIDYLKYIKIITALAIIILALMGSYALWNESLPDFYFRLMAITGILSVAGTSLSSLLSRLAKK